MIPHLGEGKEWSCVHILPKALWQEQLRCLTTGSWMCPLQGHWHTNFWRYNALDQSQETQMLQDYGKFNLYLNIEYGSLPTTSLASCYGQPPTPACQCFPGPSPQARLEGASSMWLSRCLTSLFSFTSPWKHRWIQSSSFLPIPGASSKGLISCAPQLFLKAVFWISPGHPVMSDEVSLKQMKELSEFFLSN